MDGIIILRSQFTWLGRLLVELLSILIPKKSNLKQDYLSIVKVSETGGFLSGAMLYYIPVENRISFKYFNHFGGHVDFEIFEPTFELYWESFKSNLSYFSFFKPICEIKNKPSLFLYKNIRELLKLTDVENQPINRLMDFNYFEKKYKENFNIFSVNEKLIVKKNLKYFNVVDSLRAKLMFFIIWDIEYFFNNNEEYKWDYWILQYDSFGEHLIFQIDENYLNNLLSHNFNVVYKFITNNKKKLKFYDPEENLEFFNRLFDVIGILYINSESFKVPYYVSKKFINYNKNYVELLNIMYSHDYKRWEEPLCECSYLSNYEVEIGYTIEEFMQELRIEWKESISIKKEGLAERNWRLLKSLEDLMDKD